MCNTTWPNDLLIVVFAGESVYVFAIAKAPFGTDVFLLWLHGIGSRETSRRD